MKKRRIILLASALICASNIPAFAQTTSIALDNEVYVFTGKEGVYQADGKTFCIGSDSVIVHEPDKPDRILSLEYTDDTKTVQDDPIDSIQATEEADSIQTTPLVSEAIETNIAGLTVQDKSTFFAPYVPYGLRYDAQSDTLYYHEQRVRDFTDILQHDSDCFLCSITVIGSSDGTGEVDIETIRDFSQPDENGDGKLIGLNIEKAN